MRPRSASHVRPWTITPARRLSPVTSPPREQNGPDRFRRPAVEAQSPVSTGLSWFNCLSMWCQRTCQGTVFAVGWVPVGPVASAPGTGARASVACARRWTTTAPNRVPPSSTALRTINQIESTNTAPMRP